MNKHIYHPNPHTRTKLVSRNFILIPLYFVLTQGLGWRLEAADVYVDANAAAGGNGSIASPFLRITDAIARARQLRQATVISPNERIVIHVAPGNYVGTFNNNPLDNNGNKEVLPIIVNVPNLTLSGATVLDHDSRSLPTGPANGPQTKLKSGTTLTDPGQSLIVVGRTTDGWAGENVAVTGFTLEENGGVDSPGQTGIFVDRVSRFSITHNMFMHTGVGCLTRLSSGTFEDNCCVRNYGLGAAIHGGSGNHPAVVIVRQNRCTSGFGGIDFRGTPTMRTLNVGANSLAIEPLPLVYDRNNPAEAANIPDTLDIRIEQNDFSVNDGYGLWCFGFAPFFGYSTSDATQPLTSAVRATITGNTVANNGFYGFIVEPVGAFRNNPRQYISSVNATLQGNSFDGNGRSQAFFTFVSADVDLAGASLQNLKYLQNSSYQLSDLDGELTSFDYDNPVTDPFSGAALNNSLILNGGTVAAGVKVSSKK